jgi:hypothetical protein
LKKYPTLRDTVQSLAPWVPLVEKRLVQRVMLRKPTNRPSNVGLKQEPLAILNAANWKQDDFILAYGTVFDEMLKTDGDPILQRLSTVLSIRIFATTALKWPLDSKYRTRDWASVAKAFAIEAALISSYRTELITACPRTRTLRNELLIFFSSLTPNWGQLQKGDENMLAFVPHGEWTFPDNIIIPDNIPAPPVADQEAVRSQIQIESSQQKAATKKKPVRKSKPIIISDEDDHDLDEDDEDDEDPSQFDPSTAADEIVATAKDSAPSKRSDDIQSLMSALKTIQKHKLLQCSDPEAPSGSTETIVTLAVSIIGSVRFISIFPILNIPPLTFYPQVAYRNKARIEYEETRRSRKGKGKQKETEFNMTAVKIPDLNLSAHSITNEYRDAARIHSYP